MPTFVTDGFEIIDNFLSINEIDQIINNLNKIKIPRLKGGFRNIEDKIPQLKKLFNSNLFISLATYHLKGQARLNRTVFFNKNLENNWAVPWHQDTMLCVKNKIEQKGWGPWSEKNGNLYVQPPVEMLNQMVAFRLHLDDSNVNSGCLKIIPNTHKSGILNRKQILETISSTKEYPCVAKRGSLISMHPLILHSSSKTISNESRRILHIEYCHDKIFDTSSQQKNQQQ